MQAVCQLTGLRELKIDLSCFADVEKLPQLTQLQQLTTLTCDGPWAVARWRKKVKLDRKVRNTVMLCIVWPRAVLSLLLPA
jgi:hypothetical protein